MQFEFLLDCVQSLGGLVRENCEPCRGRRVLSRSNSATSLCDASPSSHVKWWLKSQLWIRLVVPHRHRVWSLPYFASSYSVCFLIDLKSCCTFNYLWLIVEALAWTQTKCWRIVIFNERCNKSEFSKEKFNFPPRLN